MMTLHNVVEASGHWKRIFEINMTDGEWGNVLICLVEKRVGFFFFLVKRGL